MVNHNKLNTTVLPQYNCNNCAYFISHNKEIVETKNSPTGNNSYAIECENVVHPLEDCILRGFEGHSEQPTFSQTINK